MGGEQEDLRLIFAPGRGADWPNQQVRKLGVFFTVRRPKTRLPGTDFSSWSPAATRRTHEVREEAPRERVSGHRD